MKQRMEVIRQESAKEAAAETKVSAMMEGDESTGTTDVDRFLNEKFK